MISCCSINWSKKRGKDNKIYLSPFPSKFLYLGNKIILGMDKGEKQELITRLESERERLLRHIDDLKELTQPIEPDCAIGRVSRMDAINNKSVNEAALRTAEQKLKKIQETFKRVDDPMFGVCRKCGAKIPMGRLIIMPESATCVKCTR